MKTFSKQPLTIEQQIDLLKKRGMSIPEPSRASHYLTHISYYRLSGYWRPFEQENGESNHLFVDGTSFDQVLQHYIFDRELRLWLMDAIERIEVSFRNQLATTLAMKYGSHAYLFPEHFSSHKEHVECLASQLREITRSKEPFMKHYRETYNDPDLPPIWVATKIMSLGQLSRWYKMIREPAIRQQIADTYQIDESLLSSFLHHLTPVRNTCAHHGRVWNRRLTLTMRLPKKKPPGLYVNFNPDSDGHIYNTLVMLAYMMDTINPGHHWKLRLGELFERHPQVSERSMGFPDEWRDRPIWKGRVA